VPLIEIAVIILLILLNGVLALSEMAIVSSRKARLEAMASSGSRGARTALKLLDDPTRFLSTIQIGITLVGIFAGAFGGATLAEQLGAVLDAYPLFAPNGEAVAFFVVVVLITYLSLVVGELVPKRIALQNPERVAALVAPPMRAVSRVAAPVVWLLRVTTDAILRILGVSAVRDATITEDEIKLLVAEGARTGIFVPEEREMIEGVLRLADRSARAVMTPRAEVVWVDVAATPEAVAATFEASGFTEVLVCEGSVDHPVGLLDARDLVGPGLRGERISIDRLRKKTLFVAEQISVLQLLDVFRREGNHFAVILDEYGSTQGIVTDADILASIAGELPQRAGESDPMVVRRADGSLLIDGMMPIDEFEAETGFRGLRGAGDFETVAGFVIDRLGRLPAAGDQLVLPEMEIEVVDMDGRRIDKLLVTLSPPSEDA
jgi:putative hemolysin